MSQDITIDRTFLLDTLTDLVQINSVNPSLRPNGPGEAEIAAYVATVMQHLGLEVFLHKHAPRRVSVVGRRPGQGGGRSLMLNAHTDTVGIEGMDAPFAAEVRDGRMYGRGTQDMKGSLAACLAAVHALQAAATPLAGDVIIAAVADEEYDSIGTAEVVGRYPVDGAIVTEPSDLAVCLAHKGFVWFVIETIGRAAHGSRPDEGIDANRMMGYVLRQLDRLAETLAQRPGHPLTGPPSLHVGRLEGGTEWSVYAARCVAHVERRIVPGETQQDAEDEIEAILEILQRANPDFQIQARTISLRKPFVVAPNTPIVQATRQAVTQVLGQPAAMAGQTFWTDAALLAAAGVDTVVLGPIGAGLHTNEEWVDLDSVEKLAQMLALAACSYCG